MLFGPVLGYDLVRTARRSRFFWLRAGYAVAMLFLLLAVYVHNQNTDTWRGGLVRRGTIAQFAEGFFFAFTCAEIGVVVLLTPIYAAGAIAEEKESGTLEFLLATDLRSREIVLSKLVSRLANLALLVLTGLPILGLVQFLGGVDPNLVLTVFAATGLTLMSLASLSVLLSVYAAKPRDAIVLTYLVTIAYLGASSVYILLLAMPRLAVLTMTSPGRPWTVDDFVEGIAAGNPLWTWLQLREALLLGLPLTEVVPGLLRRYALFHGLVTGICVLWAMARLRPVAMKHLHGRPRRALRRLWFRARPHVGNKPMIWKELFIERGFASNWFGRTILALIFLASFGPAVWLGCFFVFDISNPLLRDGINQWVRLVGTLVACLTLLGVAVRAASSIRGESDRQTLDNLLTSPLSASAILFGKWLGSLFSVRWAWLWLCLIWLLGVCTGGLSIATVPWLALCWTVYAAFLGMLGLWFSTVCRTTLRATLWTLGTAAFLGVGNGFLWMAFGLTGLFPKRSSLAEIVPLQMYGLTPPIAFSWLAFHGDNLQFKILGFGWDDPMETLNGILGGMIFWTVTGGLLWVGACRRLNTLAGRRLLARPVQSPAFPTESLASVPKQAVRKSPHGAGVRIRWKRLAWTAALPVLAALAFGAAWYGEVASTADQALQEALAETDRLDPGWRLEDLRNQRTVVADDDNAALLVLAIYRSLGGKRGWEYYHFRPDFQSLLPERQLDARQLALLSKELTPAGPALARVSGLDGFSTGCDATSQVEEIGFWYLSPQFEAVNGVASVLWWQALLQAQQGNAEGALANCRRIVIVARCHGDEPSLLSQNHRAAKVQAALTAMERVLAQGQASAEALAAVQRLLEEEDSHLALLIAVRSERALIDRWLNTLQTGEVSVANFTEYGNTTTQTIKRMVHPGYLKAERAAVLHRLTQVVEIAKLPEADRGTPFRELEKEKLPQARYAGPFQSRIDNLFVHLTPIVDAKAKLRCALAALACERYRLLHGRWPESLEALVQARLVRQAPTDPFDGAELRFQRLPDGLLIDALARDPDLRLRSSPRRSEPLDGTPLGFRLWDVRQRRQPPRADAPAR